MKNRFTTADFAQAKQKNKKITMLTAYDYSMAKIIDQAGIDCLLVGDSLGMVVQGYDSTLEVTMEDMIYHCKAVARATQNSLIIADMPFLSYHISVEEAVRNAGRLIQQGKAHAVKLEGGIEMTEKIKAIIGAQIPVLGHIGLTPQSVNVFGGFKVQGKELEKAKKLIQDAKALQEAGAFGIVLEAVPEELARIITESVKIPTIGIGAGRYCDGQVLVINDMLGMYSDFTPKFVKQYASLSNAIQTAVKDYAKEVEEGSFPEKKHSFTMEEEILEKLY